MRNSKSNAFLGKGFTLIELMIVVAIIGIIAAIAYPAYKDSVRKSRRADAKSALLENAQFMERVFTENKSYRPGGDKPALPVTAVPKDSGTKFYGLDSVTTDTSFTLTATPQNAQSSDKCGTLTLNHTGQKGNAAGVPVEDCW